MPSAPKPPKINTSVPDPIPPPAEPAEVELAPSRKKKSKSRSSGKSRLTIPAQTSGTSGLGIN